MTTVKQLEAEVAQLKALLASRGIVARPQAERDVTKRADYIPFGSPQHAAFLGLVKVEKDEEHEEAVQVYTSPRTGDMYRLEDPITPFMTSHDPGQVAWLVLRQKVNELELVPEVPPDAPLMFVPRDLMPELI